MKEEFSQSYNLPEGFLVNENPSEDELWRSFHYLLTGKSKTRTSYKYCLLKSILDSMFVAVLTNGQYVIKYDDVFLKFTENYWDLVLKYGIKQIRKDGKSNISKIEKILLQELESNSVLTYIEFESLNQGIKDSIVRKVTKECKKYVVGALYGDLRGLFYGFSGKKEILYFSQTSFTFLIKHKIAIEKITYYLWARYLETVNIQEQMYGIFEKLESLAKRNDLSIYKQILYDDLGQHKCFYCGGDLKDKYHADHFVPWSFVKDDKIWNLVLSCPSCNEGKKDKVVGEKYIKLICERNKQLYTLDKKLIKKEMLVYNDSLIEKMCKFAICNGFQKIDI